MHSTEMCLPYLTPLNQRGAEIQSGPGGEERGDKERGEKNTTVYIRLKSVCIVMNITTKWLSKSLLKLF
jgi:hypothetical protein